MRIVLARAGMWVAMSGYNRDGGTRGRANRNCTLVRREIRIYERCWSRGRTIFWDRLEPTAIYDGGDSNWRNEAGRMGRNERGSQWRESWRSCCIDCGSVEKFTNRCATSQKSRCRPRHSFDPRTATPSPMVQKPEPPLDIAC